MRIFTNLPEIGLHSCVCKRLLEPQVVLIQHLKGAESHARLSFHPMPEPRSWAVVDTWTWTPGVPAIAPPVPRGPHVQGSSKRASHSDLSQFGIPLLVVYRYLCKLAR